MNIVKFSPSSLSNLGCGQRSYMERILAKAVPEPSGCWYWSGSKDVRGYGSIEIGKKIRKAHRISYYVFKGDIPPGLLVCHHCDNPQCVNPAHLFVGTYADNSADMVAKGRSAKGFPGPGKGKPGRAIKLTIETAGAIRRDPRTCREIAKDYGVNANSVSRIKRGITWFHAP